MDRRTFLKFLGIGTATAVVAPKLLPKQKAVFEGNSAGQITSVTITNAGYGYESSPQIMIFPKPGVYQFNRETGEWLMHS